jgi:hypothetical protein
MAKAVTVGQIAKALRCHERSARLYLCEVNQRIDRYAENLGELIDIATVLALHQRHRETIIGRRLAPLLQAATI